MVDSEHHKGEMKMSIFEDTDAINAILNQLADEDAVEPMAEPIDDPNCDPFDYAEVTGLWDEMYPEPIDADDLARGFEMMVDENDKVWYVA
jgi:hypothetical protein